MKVVALSSGSKGNTIYIETKNTKLLLDIGNTCKYVKEKLSNINVDPKDIDGIFITHTHKDHVNGLKVFVGKYNTKVYLTEKMLEDLSFLENYELIIEDKVIINDIVVEVIKTSHDAPDSRGYIVNCGNNSIVYITDTGYINRKYFNQLSNKNIYLIESNHDVEMLESSSYPFHLRKRILGDKGHLSNYDSAKYVVNFIGEKTKCIILTHLSEENNTPELAYNSLVERLEMENKTIEKIIISKQSQETEVVEI